MSTLKNLIDEKKCRKGPPAGTTKKGAYWLACEPILIRNYGGDGVGNNAVDCSHRLELRHYRSGDVTAMIHVHRWHQNGAGIGDSYHSVDLLGCTTIEQIVVRLKGMTLNVGYGDGERSCSDHCEKNLVEGLVALGLPDADPSPDESE